MQHALRGPLHPKRNEMRVVAVVTLWAGVVVSPLVHAQPAPKRDISGIWDPGREGIQGSGAKTMPGDGKHEPPYTAFGLEMMKRNRSSNGPEPVAAVEENDPGHICDPLGFPRANLFEFRTTQFLQNPQQTIMLYTYGRVYRGDLDRRATSSRRS